MEQASLSRKSPMKLNWKQQSKGSDSAFCDNPAIWNPQKIQSHHKETEKQKTAEIENNIMSLSTYFTHCHINCQKKLFEVKVVISVQVEDAEHMTCDQCCISWKPEIIPFFLQLWINIKIIAYHHPLWIYKIHHPLEIKQICLCELKENHLLGI